MSQDNTNNNLLDVKNTKNGKNTKNAKNIKIKNTKNNLNSLNIKKKKHSKHHHKNKNKNQNQQNQNQQQQQQQQQQVQVQVPQNQQQQQQQQHSLNNTDNQRKIPQDVRIAVIGNVDSGKSTMIGVLTSGEYDDGRGLARSRILRHNHEKSNGRTSCSSQHILGFSTKSKPIHQPISISATPKQKTSAWKSVFISSSSIVTFIDLAGHEKYLKTTISGLTGCFPDYAFIVIGANMGISRMTHEHIRIAIALSIPLFVVITKIDISPEKILKHTVKTLIKLLRSNVCNNKMGLIIRKKKQIKMLFQKDLYLGRICPIFCVSAVKGDNIDKLNYFLSQLKPRKPWKHIPDINVTPSPNPNPNLTNQNITPNSNDDIKDGGSGSGYNELEIDETFAVRGVGIVVSGTVTSGKISANQKLYLGPFTDCSFREILIRSVHMKRVSVLYACEGESCSISFRFIKRKEIVDRIMIRKGMVVVSDRNNKPSPVWGFTATILVLHHPTTINEGYQPVVHCGNIRQTATIMKMSKHRLRSGDSSLIDMKFLCHPEYLHYGRPIIIREGNTKCIGKVIKLYTNYDINQSDFNVLSKIYLNNNNTSSTPSAINNSTIVNNDLIKLENEIKELQNKQKLIKKEKKKQAKALKKLKLKKKQQQLLPNNNTNDNDVKSNLNDDNKNTNKNNPINNPPQ